MRSRALYTPPVTPRKSATPEVGELTIYLEATAEGGVGNWGEVVTRYPYRKVRMDHLLSKEKSLEKGILGRSLFSLSVHFIYFMMGL